MTELDVQIRKLPPMCVASFHAFGKTPERDAWEKARAWAEPRGLLDNMEEHPVFGFNNPSPTKGQTEYGYEFWIRIESDMQVDDIKTIEFPGGTYVVTSCKVIGDPLGPVPNVWQMLLKWVEANSHRWRRTHELERIVNPGAPESDLVLELYLPIEED